MTILAAITWAALLALFLRWCARRDRVEAEQPYDWAERRVFEVWKDAA